MSDKRYKAVSPSRAEPFHGCNGHKVCIKCGERRQADENLGHGTVDHIGKRKRNRNQTVWLPGSHEHILEG